VRVGSIPRRFNMLLEVKNLKTHFEIGGRRLFGRRRFHPAVDGVDLTLRAGETLAIVGESGSGKSTLARSILRLIPPTEGEVYFHGKNLMALPPAEMRKMRQKMQMIFQDPYASLNPRMTVLDLVAEPLDVHLSLSRAEREAMVVAMLSRVGLSSDMRYRYPHEFSGGQRQRIGIARAMILHPDLVVADEPVSALDVSIQGQVLALLSDLQTEFRLAYLFISHDLSLVRRFANRTAVMYRGRIVEMAESRTLADHPLHPYTQRLQAAVPAADPRRRDLPPVHSSFHSRCQHTTDRPFQLVEAEPEHFVACHLSNVPSDNEPLV